MVLFAIFGKFIGIIASCLVIVTMLIFHDYIQRKLINIQELLLLYNYIILCALLLFNESVLLSLIIVNVMVGLSFLHSVLIMVYHLFVYLITTPCTKLINMQNYSHKELYNGELPLTQ